MALARALVKRPKVLLLDEPLSALDAKLREAMRIELAADPAKVGITFVMVTHDQDEAHGHGQPLRADEARHDAAMRHAVAICMNIPPTASSPTLSAA